MKKKSRSKAKVKIKAAAGEKKVKKEFKTMLKVRKKTKARKPSFPRQEVYRLKKLKDGWRRPRGRHSKLRKSEKARGTTPRAGYGSPRAVRGLTRYGYREIRISTPAQLKDLNPEKDAVLISSAVGKRKRTEIVKKAEDMKLFVVNK